LTTLTTDRLVLRPFAAGDAEAHARLYDDPEVTRWLGDGPWLGEAARARSRLALERFAQEWARHGWGVWAVTDRTSGALMGQCGLKYLQLDRAPAPPEVEVLYALERRHWGRGLASEAAAAALDHGFGPLALPRIVAVARPDNGPSRAVLEKLGLRYERDLVLGGIPAVCYAQSRTAHLARGARASAGRTAP
jgi:[ribosomal protein S5]-alanine N-acetyltransferase